MFTLDEIVPFGRSFDDYRRMFALRDEDFRLRILGCADGPASFNAEATQKGCRVISCDPLYQFAARQICSRIQATYHEVMEQARRNQGQFIWDEIPSLEALGRLRMQAMLTFLADFEPGAQEGRYVVAGLPSLPFPDAHFDVALCSHFLFLYSDHLTLVFHRQAIVEMCRVAAEVRIFPLLTLGGCRSSCVGPVMEHLRKAGLVVTVEKVPYEFQRGANEMMRVRHLR